jgi:hypothetical protein
MLPLACICDVAVPRAVAAAKVPPGPPTDADSIRRKRFQESSPLQKGMSLLEASSISEKSNFEIN